ncbi:MAG: DUF4419 domain-containing protein [Bacteroidota bacterium]
MILTKGKIQVKQKTIDSIRFQIEELERPTAPLPEIPIDQILANFSTKIESHSPVEGPLVFNGTHPFFMGLYQAYAEHRPFVLSPDMIWLLICQGFSRHLNFNEEARAQLFPQLQSKQALVIINNDIRLGEPASPWAESTAQFVDAIEDQIGGELMDILRADFSTTGITERVATEITIMDAMKPFFEYVLALCVCGIPEITLEGASSDWEKILVKLEKLRSYHMAWWTDRLVPIIEELVATAKGKINNAFWMNIFKVHTIDDYGDPQYIDGWITQFYPYDRDGKQIDFAETRRLRVEDIIQELPKEIVAVDFIYRILDPSGQHVLSETPMIYWAGFIGLQQDRESFSLRPEIGWLVSYDSKIIPDESEFHHESDSRIYYNLEAFPEELFEREEWGELTLNFKDQISVPMRLLQLSIFSLELNGRLTKAAAAKILLLKQKIGIVVNGVKQ